MRVILKARAAAGPRRKDIQRMDQKKIPRGRKYPADSSGQSPEDQLPGLEVPAQPSGRPDLSFSSRLTEALSAASHAPADKLSLPPNAKTSEPRRAAVPQPAAPSQPAPANHPPIGTTRSPAVNVPAAPVPPLAAERIPDRAAPAARAPRSAVLPAGRRLNSLRPGWLVVIGFGAGVLLTALVAVIWTAFGPHRQEIVRLQTAHTEEIKKLQIDLETARFEASNLRTGSRNLSTLLNAFSTDWDRPPEKPRYRKTPDGALIYWEDQMIWRQYYVYQGKGGKGAMVRFNSRPQKKAFIYLANPTPGTWRFSVTALNKEGKETLPGEVLTLRFPLD
jgi:hypothetical protein